MGPFELIPTPISGCFEIRPRVFEDNRGRFIKVFHRNWFVENKLNADYEEQYYSVSKARVIRGLHFQSPPNAHVKLVSCITGSICDVVVDLRKSSTTYHQVFSLELNSLSGNMLYVPEGLAHGFYVLSERCIFLSMNSRKFAPECDQAIRWNSINFNWPDNQPVVSEKDKNAIKLEQYNSPF
ncbi:MAG: dTDP-4-dehydrorhamnose 3,5-epimerase family protein [Bacteroidales bacterium]|nr:dTDP-4-dehydrorhamnose 3,5-epimerase family protein [Bacteroidales bacterium]